MTTPIFTLSSGEQTMKVSGLEAKTDKAVISANFTKKDNGIITQMNVCIRIGDKTVNVNQYNEQQISYNYPAGISTEQRAEFDTLADEAIAQLKTRAAL